MKLGLVNVLDTTAPGNIILKGWQHVAGGRAQRTPPVTSNESSHPEGMPEKPLLASFQDAFQSLEHR